MFVKVVRIISEVVKKVVALLISQAKELIKAREKEKALEQALNRILNEVENEPYYTTISKLIERGSLAQQIIYYCEHVSASGKSIKTFCDDVVAGCKIETANKSQVNGVIYKIAICFFNIINNPKDSDINEALNIVLQSNARDFEALQALMLKILALLERGIKPNEFELNVPTFINPPFQKNRCFTSRDGILSEIHAAFVGGECAQYMSAAGGLGKTQIAREYITRNEKEYERILWVNAENETSVLYSYQEFIDTMALLHMPKAEQTAEVIIRSVHNWMSTQNSWLFVYDNVENDPDSYNWWPKNYRGHILITTQKSDLTNAKKVSVPPFNEEESIAFFMKRTEKKEQESMRALAVRLGGYPLALEQAAAYIIRNKKTGFKEYLDLLNEALSVLDKTKGVIEYKHSIIATTQIAIKRIQMEPAKQLLYLCSYFAPDNIDPALFRENTALLPAPLKDHFAKKLSENDVWQELTNYSLLESRDGETGYSMHRLLQEVVRSLIGDDKQWAQFCLGLFLNVFDFEYGNTASHNEFLQLLPHVEAFLRSAASCFTEKEEQTKIANLYHEGGWGLTHLGNYTHALEWHQKALAIFEKTLGTEHPDTATTYNNIAGVYNHQGDYPKALTWYQKALAIREKVLGTEHPDTAATYNNIALVYDSQGDYPKALVWYQKALAISEKVLGTEHPDTATTYNNIAGVYYNQGDFPKALVWYQKDLAISEKVLGTEHPDTAVTYNNIALVYRSQGDYPKALDCFQKSLTIREKVLGTEHPDTAATYNNIALVYDSQGDYPKALVWYQKDLAISEKVLGTEHPDTAVTYNNIAFVYHSQGDFPKALEWFQKAYAVFIVKLGAEHPYTKSVAESIQVLQKK